MRERINRGLLAEIDRHLKIMCDDVLFVPRSKNLDGESSYKIEKDHMGGFKITFYRRCKNEETISYSFDLNFLNFESMDLESALHYHAPRLRIFSGGKIVAYCGMKVAFYHRIQKVGDKFGKENLGLKLLREQAEYMQTLAKNCGFIPLCPPAWMGAIYSEEEERDLIMAHCLELVRRCDVFLFDPTDLAFSKGLRMELNEAKKHGLYLLEKECGGN